MTVQRRVSPIVRSDLAMLMTLGFTAMVIFMLPFLNPPTQEDQLNPPGNMIVTAYWPPGNIDVDLWVLGPGEARGVGYSNTSGILFNLLRDDLGVPDERINFENAYSRGLPDGEYIINLHCYRCPSVPVEVTVDVKMKPEQGKPAIDIVTSRVLLTRDDQEKTVARFHLANKRVVDGSLHNVFRPLRGARYQ